MVAEAKTEGVDVDVAEARAEEDLGEEAEAGAEAEEAVVSRKLSTYR